MRQEINMLKEEIHNRNSEYSKEFKQESEEEPLEKEQEDDYGYKIA